MTLEIEKNLVELLVRYLSQKPYAEVAGYVEALLKLKEKPEGEKP